MRRCARTSCGLPKGIPEPLIVGRGINDVAIIVLTLSAEPDKAADWTDNGLYQVAEELQHELAKVENVGGTYLVGGSPNQIRVEPDPERLSLYGDHAQSAHRQAHQRQSLLPGRRVSRRQPLRARRGGADPAGRSRHRPPPADVARRPARLCQGRGRRGRRRGRARASRLDAHPPARTATLQRRPAVSLAIAKRKGANAVDVADDVMQRLDNVKGRIIPAGLDVDGDAQLRRDGDGKGERTAVPSRRSPRSPSWS